MFVGFAWFMFALGNSVVCVLVRYLDDLLIYYYLDSDWFSGLIGFVVFDCWMLVLLSWLVADGTLLLLLFECVDGVVA